ncbi:MAG: tail fiber domain-containing protein [Vicingaceae bacterium]
MKKILVYIFILLSPFWLNAQNVSINDAGTPPDNSAMLDVSSTNSGLLIPRMTLVQRNALVNPATSLLIYQTDNTPGYYFNSGTSATPVWTQLRTSGDNLGNHIATSNIQLGTNYLSGDGGNEGIRIDATGNVGIGTINPSSPLNVKQSVLADASDGAFIDIQNGQGVFSSLSGIRFKNNSIDGNVRYNAAVFHRINTSSDYQLNFAVRLNALNNIDTSDIKMTINNNGNVGIGTTAPTNRLTVYQNSATPFMSLKSDGSNTLMRFENTGSNSADWTFGYLGNTGVNPGFMTFLRSGAHRMVITNDGNVGIGTTTPNRQLHINTTGTFSFSSFTTSATGTLQTDGLVLGYADAVGAAIFNYENSNLAFGTNNAYRMWLNPSGNLGVGTATPIDRLEVFNAGNVRVRTRTSTNGFSGLVAENSVGEYFLGIQGAGDPNPGEFHIYQNSPTAAQRMVIDGAGNVGIGTANPNAVLTVSSTGTTLTSGIQLNNGADDWYMYQNATQDLILRDDGTDRFYINSSGNFGMGGAPNNTYRLQVSGNINAAGGNVFANGALLISDQRYKNNITPITNVLSTIGSLRGIYHNWDQENFPEMNFGSERNIGFIAQEMQKVYPEIVTEKADGYLTVDYSKFTAVLLEAIKEQQVLIDQQSQYNNTQQSKIDELTQKLELLEQELIKLKKGE